jgi:hypothetical protein
LLLRGVLFAFIAGAETIRTALVNFCDPTKIDAITAECGANTRARKALELDTNSSRWRPMTAIWSRYGRKLPLAKCSDNL